MAVKLLKGDCIERLAELPPGSVDMVCADPPYGVTTATWDEIIPFDKLWPLLYRVCKPKAVFAMTATQPFVAHLLLSNASNYRYSWYWHKPNPTNFANAKRMPLRNVEEVLIFCRENGATYNPQGVVKLQGVDRHRKNGSAYREGLLSLTRTAKGSMYMQENTNYPKQLLSVPRDEEKFHTTQKPVALMAYMIRTYTNPGDTVLDFCAGSGTTGVAAVNDDRNFIGIEKKVHNFEIMQERVRKAHSPFDKFRGKAPQRQERTRRGT